MPLLIMLRSPTTALVTLISSVMVLFVKVSLFSSCFSRRMLGKLGLKRCFSNGNELVLRYAIYAFDWPKILLLCASRETGNANSGFLLSTKLIFFGFHITLFASTTKHVL